MFSLLHYLSILTQGISLVKGGIVVFLTFLEMFRGCGRRYATHIPLNLLIHGAGIVLADIVSHL